MQQVGRYTLTATLGAGGFGTVYLATDPATGEQVAVKVLDWPDHDDRRAMFRQEVAALLSVASPHVVRVRDVIDQPGLAAIVTDYVEGASLRQVLDRQGPLTGPQALSVLSGALRGLAAVHAAGLVHADLKPENILLDRSGSSRLIDFGIAGPPRVLGGPDTWIGTPAYLAPEVVLGQHIDLRSDLYAVAATLFELLAGRPPYVGPNPVATALLHVQAPVPDLRALHAGVHEHLAVLCAQDLAKDPVWRHQNTPAFLASLDLAATAAFGPDWATGTAVAGATASVGALVGATLALLPHAGVGILGAAPMAGPLAAAALGAAGFAGGGAAGGLAGGGFAGGGAAGGLAGGGAAGGLAGGGAAGGLAGSGAGAAGTLGGAAAAGAGGSGVAGTGGGIAASAGGVKAAIAAAAAVATIGAGAATVVLLDDDEPAAAPPPVAVGDVFAYLTADTSLVVMKGEDEVGRFPDATAPAWSGDGRFLVTTSGGDVVLVDTRDGGADRSRCVAPNGCTEATIWDDGRVVAIDGAQLVTFGLPDLADRTVLADAPGQVVWNDVLATGDDVLAFGFDEGREGEGYRGGPPAVAHHITESGAVEPVAGSLRSVSLWGTTPVLSTRSAYGGTRAAVMNSGSGGACVYGNTIFLVDPADPGRQVETDASAMVALAPDDHDEQEYQVVTDLWFDGSGVLHASGNSGLCDFNGGSRPGVPQQIWRLDGTTWVPEDDRPLLTARTLPSGNRLELARVTATDLAAEVALLTLVDADGSTEIADDATRLFTPQVKEGVAVAAPAAATPTELAGDDGVGALVDGTGDTSALATLPRDFQSFIGKLARTQYRQARRGGFTTSDCDESSTWVNVSLYDARGFARGGVGACGGYAALWAKVGGTWREILGTQESWDCADLVRYEVPASLIAYEGHAECYSYADGNGPYDYYRP
ncbi:hypothetical protein BJ993_001281 [Nocardioides aromaticivorans]|uniref:Protein kinase domain-containing protein n=1 Tax=Nocardioides aromaticivorans TaxID=200618 RepID=A0A7Y9ZIR1_9ACTN|nr:serine/threonine-protein kinase [Nocardioides aromaticivorans]NYI44201.1 hypothetical protein [Nocardioides aromaticivorans]